MGDGAKPPAKKQKDDPDAVRELSTTATLIKNPVEGEDAGVLLQKVEEGSVKGNLTWDVELILNDIAKGRDRFYNMQLVVTRKHPHKFWTVMHWGRTGLQGQMKVNGPKDYKTAQKDFRAKYRSKTGNAWGQLGDDWVDVDGKYTHVVKEAEEEAPEEITTRRATTTASTRAAPSTRASTAAPSTADSLQKGDTRWQFYMHAEMDGKKIGWYPYDKDAAQNLEKMFKLARTNTNLGVRIVHTSYFAYEININSMIQTNIKTGTRRVIRRIEEGEEASPDPPSSIPEPVKPRELPKDEEEDADDHDQAAVDDEEEAGAVTDED